MKNIESRVKNITNEIFKEFDIDFGMKEEVIEGVIREVKQKSSGFVDDEELKILIIMEMVDWDLV